MKQIIFLLSLFAFVFISCEDPRDQIRFPVKYTFRDTVLDYRLTHNELVLSFPKGTKDTSWWIETFIADSQSVNWDYQSAMKTYRVKNNELHIPVTIADSLDPQQLLLRVWGFPNVGTLVRDGGRGYRRLETFFYEVEGGQFRVFSRYYNFDSYWLLPDSLVKGKDSAYFRLRKEAFIRDSIDMTPY